MTNRADCPKCEGAGWVWGHELNVADEDTQNDTMTKYSCDECEADPPASTPHAEPVGQPTEELMPWWKEYWLPRERETSLIERIRNAANALTSPDVTREEQKYAMRALDDADRELVKLTASPSAQPIARPDPEAAWHTWRVGLPTGTGSAYDIAPYDAFLAGYDAALKSAGKE